MVWAPSVLPKRSAKIGPIAAVTANVKKLIAPVALPLTSSGFTSLMMVYGIMAAPEATPRMNSVTHAGSIAGK